jgi:hypothetical protein
MIIQDSSLSLASQHLSLSHYQKKESLKMWVGSQRPDFEGTAKKAAADTVALSGQQPASSATETSKTDQANSADLIDPKLSLLQSLIQTLTGRKVSIAELRKIVAPTTSTGSDGQASATADGQPVDTTTAQGTQSVPATAQSGQAAATPSRAGYGVEYDSTETTSEVEQTNFSASGVIKTADGKEINFNIGLSMSRQYASQTSTSLRAGDAVTKDPLVVNFNGTATQLTDTKFNFDINGDGTTESVASLGGGSGYLALDKNHDGKINNGTELFGAKTGNGFSELAAYDQNKDGWIDEQDSVYSQLKIWNGGSNGLTSLKDAGVGAIGLANQQTPFAIKDSSNKLLGEVRATGVYVNENGTVGTVQQVDLAV